MFRFKFVSGYESLFEIVDDLNKNLEELLNNANYSYDFLKTKQSAQSSQKYYPPNYVVGSKVWMNKSPYKHVYSHFQQSD